MRKECYKALILDDENFVGDILAEVLAVEGIETLPVTDVDTAIAKLKNDSFDIVISDVFLPGKNGHDFFNYARQYYPDIPFIFITGNPNLETAVNFLKNGAYDYLAKPFRPPELVNKVREVIRKSRQNNRDKSFVKELKQILNQRLEELNIYQDIFESQKDGLLIIDTDGVIVKINPGFVFMSGLNESDLIDQHINILKEKIFPPFEFDTVQAAILKAGYWRAELKGKRMNGERWIASCSFYPIQNEAGKTFAFSGIINDVTSFWEVEEALIDSLRSTNMAQEAIIFGLARLAEYRDQDTGFHLEKIRSYCRELATAMAEHPHYEHQISKEFIDNIYRTAPLHDIGKVGVPDHILLKPGKLTKKEFEIIKTHTRIGAQTLDSIRKQYSQMKILDMGIEITQCHHEWFDGQGYPDGLKGDAIPLSAQIAAIADVYDALTSPRIYKKAFSHKTTIHNMKQDREKHFDPILFDIFLSISDTFDIIRTNFHTQEKLQHLLQATKSVRIKSA